MLSAGKDVIESIFRIFKLLIVRDESAGFYREDKIVRRSVSPGFKSFDRGQAIEAVVQFQGVKVMDVVVEHLGCQRLWRIKRADPVLVMIAGSADANVATHA